MDDSKRTQLLQGNYDVLRIWFLVKDQLIITSAGFVVGINLDAVLKAADIIGYEDEIEDLVLNIQQIKDIWYNREKKKKG